MIAKDMVLSKLHVFENPNLIMLYTKSNFSSFLLYIFLVLFYGHHEQGINNLSSLSYVYNTTLLKVYNDNLFHKNKVLIISEESEMGSMNIKASLIYYSDKP